jgi:hypothetical protein
MVRISTGSSWSGTVLLTPPYVDQIHNSDIDLDPEYQRGEELDLRRVYAIANT